ncbi:E3 ubiquitin-protein ligase TRIM39-like [Conger conger]|uniref:E3 ubiquitin-protein ligase TRIM39-like n=1 Tax=Conger conger TaxID=82655 RepID=UPI002A59DD00|nr:E3 ubiquitin-protein ligase TRIM39-like [Conger conger]XP_061107140.1 E3 ubiquitin-protein ligase TRIM39-like [Conger conger]
MASCRGLLSEEQFQCSLCSEVFSSPVSTPCGHSFCRACIQGYWQGRGACICPRCGAGFPGWPGLCENAFAREMVEKFRRLRLERPRPEDPAAAPPGGMACDVCIAGKQAAVKSCLVCLTSYCQPHLEPHLRVEGLKRHKLLPPTADLQDRQCREHQRPLELFCRSDQSCVCVLCTDTLHKSHDCIPAERAWTEKQAQLKKTEAEVQQMMQDRWKKVEEIRQCVELSRSSTQREIEDSAQVFSTLMRSIETRQAELTEVMEEKQRAVEKHAEDLIKDLEQELTELQNKKSQLENLSQTEDHLYFLQSFQSQCTLPNTQDWSGAGIHTDVCVGAVRRCVEQLEVSLAEQEDKLAQMEMQKLCQYSVGVVLDPDTAHPWLALSADGGGVGDGEQEQDVPDGPLRFDRAPCVLAQDAFSSGRRYWEVQVGDKTSWDLGVARASITRKGGVTLSPGYGFWALCVRGGSEYQACADPPLPLPLRERPRTVGVFLDYEAGQVSFYNVGARTHIYSFTDCSFTEPLYPYFSPGVNDNGTNTAPLTILSPVNHVGGGASCDEQPEEEELVRL